MKRAPRQAGFTLLPVVLAMTLIAAIAFLLNRSNGVNAQMIANQSDVERARYAAEAGLQAVDYQVQQAGCGGGFPTSAAPVTNNNFGGATYTAYADQASGFPVTLTSIGSYNGASVTLTRANATVFQAAMKSMAFPDVADTYVGQYTANNNAGAATTLTLWSGNEEMLVQFDFSGLPAGSRIIPYYSGGALQAGATMSLYQSSGPTNSGQIAAYLITHSWVEGTGFGGASTSGATWNTYDGTNGWPSGAGAGYDSRALSTSAYSSGTGWRTWDITDAALAWTDSVYPNYGVWIRSSPGSTINNVSYVSKENANTAEYPYVTANYLAPCSLTTTVPLTPSADTWIDSSQGGKKNYGSATTFTVTSSTGRGLVQFDLSTAATHIPLNTNFTSVVLKLWASSFDANGNATSNLSVSPVINSQDWTEGGATWKTYDGTNAWLGGDGGRFGGSVATTAISDSFTAGSWVSFSGTNLTGLVQQWFDGYATNYGFGVQIDTSATIVFNSKDAGAANHPPQLVITY